MGMRQLYDGLLSALGGFGRPFDRSTTCYFPLLMTDQEIDAAFRASWLMRKIITKPATEMTREGRDWQADKATIEKLEAEEKRLGIKQKLQLAELLRGLGGAGMVLYVEGDDQTKPLDQSSIRAGGLTAVHVWHRSCFSLGPKLVEAWSDPWFGQPSYYEMTGVGVQGADGRRHVRFHPSRVVAFRGQPSAGLDLGMMADRWWWGDSMVEVVKEAVDNVNAAENGFAKLIRRASIRRLSVPRLLEKVATQGAEEQFKKRVSAIAIGENSDDITWLDAGDGEGKGAEAMTDHQVTWTGIPDIKSSYLMVAAAAASIPATVLLEKAPDGMNATGDGDNRNWEKEVHGRQDLLQRPCLDQLDTALVPSALGKLDPDLWYVFAPLSTPTEKEVAETFKLVMEAITALVNSGILPEKAISIAVENLIEERGFLPGLSDALKLIPKAERFPSEMAEEPADDIANGGKEVDPTSAGGGATAPKQRPARRAANDARFSDAQPRTLYVRRDVMPETVAALKAWAKKQGLPELQDGLHVTICHIDQAFDWMKVEGEWNQSDNGEMTIQSGGVRIVEPLGNRTAVLLFTSSPLSWRHESILRSAQAEDKFPSYQPHISLTGDAVDLSKVVPFRGKILLGPEIFEEVQDDVYGGAPTGDRPFADAYNAGQPRDDRGRWTSGSAFAAHVRRARSDGKEHSQTKLGKVSAANAEHVRTATGVDIDGFTRVAESSDIRHVFASHGDPAKESARKVPQMAVTEARLLQVPNIIENAHTIKAIGVPGARKLQRLEYVATIEGHEYHYIEELRPTKTIVALKTFRIVE